MQWVKLLLISAEAALLVSAHFAPTNENSAAQAEETPATVQTTPDVPPAVRPPATTETAPAAADGKPADPNVPPAIPKPESDASDQDQPGRSTQQPNRETQSADARPLTRGPIHEAFAEPIGLGISERDAIKTVPPEPIDELPAETRPDGDAQWISGYWAWDDDNNNFLWISGVWRIAPYHHRWVTGYWTETTDGYVWIAGFWTPFDTTEVTYLPAPPDTREKGPTSASPGDNYFWVPGYWVYQDVDYVWRPGYWAENYAAWTWVPNHYVWTPRGVVFVAGYWDYNLDERGLLFAPVAFTGDVYRQPDFSYSPTVAINIAGLHFHLFARPRYHHYYFGDYYTDAYLNAGFYPWFAFNDWRGYDPLFVSFRFRHGGDDAWERGLRDRYDFYRQNADARPAHTFAELQQQLETVDAARREEMQVAIDTLGADVDSELLTARELTRVGETERRQIADSSRDRLRDLRDRRSEFEKQTRETLKPTPDGQAPVDANRPKFQLPEIDRTAQPDQPAGTDRNETDRGTQQPRERRRIDNGPQTIPSESDRSKPADNADKPRSAAGTDKARDNQAGPTNNGERDRTNLDNVPGRSNADSTPTGIAPRRNRGESTTPRTNRSGPTNNGERDRTNLDNVPRDVNADKNPGAGDVVPPTRSLDPNGRPLERPRTPTVPDRSIGEVPPNSGGSKTRPGERAVIPGVTRPSNADPRSPRAAESGSNERRFPQLNRGGNTPLPKTAPGQIEGAGGSRRIIPTNPADVPRTAPPAKSPGTRARRPARSAVPPAAPAPPAETEKKP